MKREGKQHGMVRSSSVLPAELGPRPNSKVLNLLAAPPTAGVFARAPAKPTNHSKYTAKCRRAKCRDCHSAPASKSRDKAKGAHKLRSCDVLLNHRLVSWRVVVDEDGEDGRRFVNCKAFSASEMLDHLCAQSFRGGEEYEEQSMVEESEHSGHAEGTVDEEEEEEMEFFVVEVPWECSDGEDWLVVGEI
ncbi:hypothetical protein Cni_G23141 [Canna indica]|uniref:Uncharacterized protein n=1 Tax=Canna indica TaxID=4628 RepID=A0AAQ3QIX5_9LILI|nr:hypothetical protein Cni_G23141 [Canna indica]